jgi:hypothetical protein
VTGFDTKTKLVNLPIGKFTRKRLVASGFEEATVAMFVQDELSFLRTPDLGRKHINEIRSAIGKSKASECK